MICLQDASRGQHEPATAQGREFWEMAFSFAKLTEHKATTAKVDLEWKRDTVITACAFYFGKFQLVARALPEASLT